ncbi:hypothetical protein ACFPZL_07055 [Leucobacter soli]|uniref:Uncharacterized protein n=1 Tax=Leucobacter soli TaxID=2812850 RepID=A0A916JRK9_9MICO|nr:hypothetical protein [Leucobacter soli]CAG7597652.1 hypothetical protein LEUCIP111803_00157 [Leucobacter soli]
MTANPATAVAHRGRAARIAAWAWGIVLILCYVLVTVNAVGNLTGMHGIGEALGGGLSRAGWFWLILGIVLPVAALAIALLLGRGRRAGVRLLLLLAGIAVISAFQFEILLLVPQYTYFAA